MGTQGSQGSVSAHRVVKPPAGTMNTNPIPYSIDGLLGLTREKRSTEKEEFLEKESNLDIIVNRSSEAKSPVDHGKL